MPFTITCPHCRRPMTRDEVHAGQLAACPTCMGAVVVPGFPRPILLSVPKPVPPPEPPQFEVEFAPTPNYRRNRSSLGPILVVGILGVAMAGLAAVGAWVMWPKEKPKEVVVREEPRQVAKPVIFVQPAPKVAKEPEKVEPEPPKPLTFAAAWVEAEKLAAILDAEEPAQTTNAKKLLTLSELQQAQFYLASPKWIFVDPSTPGMLRRCGLTALIERQSRTIAHEDKQFSPVCRAIWDAETGSKGVLHMMNIWGQIPAQWRWQVAVTVSANQKPLFPEARDAILDLGGRKWLESR